MDILSILALAPPFQIGLDGAVIVAGHDFTCSGRLHWTISTGYLH